MLVRFLRLFVQRQFVCLQLCAKVRLCVRPTVTMSDSPSATLSDRESILELSNPFFNDQLDVKNNILIQLFQKNEINTKLLGIKKNI